MKKGSPAIILIVFFAVFFPGVEAEANCLIELKSGRSFVSSYCWEENGQIMFYQLGGVVGFPSDQVESITDTDRPEPRETPGVEPEIDLEPAQVPGAPEDVHTEEEPSSLDMDSEDFQARVEQYQEELRNLLHDRSQYYLDLEAAERNNDERALIELREKITDLQHERMSLRREVLDLYGNEFPEWWDEFFEMYQQP